LAGNRAGGHYAYFAVPTNLPAVRALRNHVKVYWFLSLRRRSQRYRLIWSRMNVIAAKHLPLPRVLHPWPEQRFLVTRGRGRMRNVALEFMWRPASPSVCCNGKPFVDAT
jgi:hypothetical protein